MKSDLMLKYQSIIITNKHETKLVNKSILKKALTIKNSVIGKDQYWWVTKWTNYEENITRNWSSRIIIIVKT